MCTMVVDLLETQDQYAETKNDWINQLLTIADEVCANVPQAVASPTQCKSYFELNAPYMVDLILSDSKSESVCKAIGVCTQPEDSTQYKLVFPTINEQQISYLVEEKEITKDTEFNYKLFLGNPSFLHNDSYELAIQLNQIVGCEVNLKITNKTSFVQTESCNSEKNCSMDISQPGRGVWYYVTVHAKMNGDTASFSFNATERNETTGYWIYVSSRHRFNAQRFAVILCVTFSSVCLLCFCISRCMFSKRTRRYKQQQQSYAPIMMQSIPETMISMQGLEPFDPDVSPVIVMYAPLPYAYGQV